MVIFRSLGFQKKDCSFCSLIWLGLVTSPDTPLKEMSHGEEQRGHLYNVYWTSDTPPPQTGFVTLTSFRFKQRKVARVQIDTYSNSPWSGIFHCLRPGLKVARRSSCCLKEQTGSQEMITDAPGCSFTTMDKCGIFLYTV